MKVQLALFAAAVALSVSVQAKEKAYVFVETKPVKDAKIVKLEPTKAYIMLRTPNAMPVHFIKLPSAEDQVAYDKLSDEAFVKAQKDYAKALKRYKVDLATAKKVKGTKLPKEPAEPTRETFQYQSFGQVANFTVGAFNRFYSEKGDSGYLQALTPGKYRIFGQVDPLLGMGVCYCMGSVTFDVEAGKITDLGTMGADIASAGQAEKGDSSSPAAAAYTMALTPASETTPVDPRIASFPRVKANFRAAGKSANYMGIAISRIPPIAGVIAYQRDRILDLKATAPGGSQ
jgi:hypothetical protein